MRKTFTDESVTSENMSQQASLSELGVTLEFSTEDRVKLGAHLMSLRVGKKLSQLQAAQKAFNAKGSHAGISRIERGVPVTLDQPKLEALANLYDTSVEALLSSIKPRDLVEDTTSDTTLESGASEGAVAYPYPEVESAVAPDAPFQRKKVLPGWGRRLFEARQSAGLDFNQTVARILEVTGRDVSIPLYKGWERGREKPLPDTLEVLGVAFGVSVNWLMEGKYRHVQEPTFRMRLSVLKKIYQLSNRDVALAAGLSLEDGRAWVSRHCTKKMTPSVDVQHAIARAFDVPVEWINPPAEGYVAPLNLTSTLIDHELIQDVTNIVNNELLTQVELIGLQQYIKRYLVEAITTRGRDLRAERESLSKMERLAKETNKRLVKEAQIKAIEENKRNKKLLREARAKALLDKRKTKQLAKTSKVKALLKAQG